MPSFLPSRDTTAALFQKEILYAYSPPPLKKGCTLRPGSGLIAAGTVLERHTASKQLQPRTGTNTCVGILYQSADTGGVGSTAPVGGNIIQSGVLKLDQLVGLDATAITDLNGRADANRNTFIF
jgi:hypothetical protein